MTIDFGLLLTPGSRKNQSATQWLDDLDASLKPLAGSIRSLWMSDHFAWDDAPTLEAWTVMSYLAARWPQFEVGASVFGQSYRNPALLAKMGATLQVLSRGRFIMGLGAGWKQDEYKAYGYPFPSAKVRLEELEDTLEIMIRLWTEPGKVTFHGKHYQITDAYCEPKPDPLPIIMVGGGGNKTKLLAARYADWWNHSDVDVAEFKRHLPILRQHCETVGRDPSTLRLTWLGRLSVGKTEAEARDRALSLGYEHYKDWTAQTAFVGTPQQVIDRIGEFVEAGVDYFMFEIIGLPNPDVMSIVIEDVLAKVR